MTTTAAATPQILVFNVPSPDALQEASQEYYRECRIAGAGSVEVELPDHRTVIVSATRYLPAGVDVGAAVTLGVLQVLCIRDHGQQVVMHEFPAWTDYTVHRARSRGAHE